MEEITVLKIGDTVPDMEMDAYLPAEEDFGKVKIKGILKSGKWLILFFYPADYTFVCPTELADIGAKYRDFKQEGAGIVSVSTDTQFVHYAWQHSEKLLAEIEFPMGADPNHKVSKLFGVYDEKTGLTWRATILIDPDGKLVASEVNYYEVGRNSEELLRKFRAFKHVRENPKHVCPARWQPGMKTLTPGKKLVGKVGEELK